MASDIVIITIIQTVLLVVVHAICSCTPWLRNVGNWSSRSGHSRTRDSSDQSDHGE